MTGALLFVVLSGAGWLLDVCLFWLGVSELSLSPGIANLASATIAAMSVYAASRKLIFRAGGKAGSSFLAYLIYTGANIVVWALAIEVIVGSIAAQGLLPQADQAALAAKLAVTPFSLGANYLVARWLSRRA